MPPLRGLRTGKTGKNVLRHDLDWSNANTIKQKKNIMGILREARKARKARKGCCEELVERAGTRSYDRGQTQLELKARIARIEGHLISNIAAREENRKLRKELGLA